VYVTQPEVKPGCVLRRSNWSVLEGRKLVDDTQVNDCKRHMNTFAFVGDLEESPEVSCVYHSEQARARGGWVACAHVCCMRGCVLRRALTRAHLCLARCRRRTSICGTR
jgi:hypothetical protein